MARVKGNFIRLLDLRLMQDNISYRFFVPWNEEDSWILEE